MARSGRRLSVLAAGVRMTARSTEEWIGATPAARTKLQWISANADHTGNECTRGPFPGSWYHAVKVSPGKYGKAHRLMCEAAHGPAPADSVAMHSCNNKWCVNPRHLSWGTVRQNSSDAIAAGLTPRGERKRKAKLTDNLVRSARADRARGMTFEALAKKYGIAKGAIWHAVNGTQWSHVR